MLKSKTLPGMIFVLPLIFCLSSCIGNASSAPPIETPGAIEAMNIPKKVIGPLASWEYDQDQMIFIYRDASNPSLIIYNWQTRKTKEIDVPDIRLEPYVIQGTEKGLIAYSVGILGESNNNIYNYENQELIAQVSGLSPTFSPDGDQLAVWKEGNLVLIDLDSWEEQVLLKTGFSGKIWKDYAISNLDWSPDGKRILYTYVKRGDTEVEKIYVVDIASAKQTEVISSTDFISSPSWSPDGRLIAYINDRISDSSALRIIDVDQKCEVGSIQIGSLSDAIWSPNGDFILLRYWASEYYLLNVNNVFGQNYKKLVCSE